MSRRHPGTYGFTACEYPFEVALLALARIRIAREDDAAKQLVGRRTDQ